MRRHAFLSAALRSTAWLLRRADRIALRMRERSSRTRPGSKRDAPQAKPSKNTYLLCTQAIGEFIDDTEDYVNITLDSHRNQLIQIDLLLTAATCCVGLMTFVAGIFGMNLYSGLENKPALFDLVSILSCVLAVTILAGFVLLMRHWQLAFV
jgi:Mg2+ and Co2+ transporter CorA